MTIGRVAVSLLLLSLGAAPALAMDIQGKWGLGVGAGFASYADFGIIHGRSPSSAWLLNFGFAGTNQNGEAGVAPDEHYPQNQNRISVRGGPGMRKFLLPSAEFTPYLDVFVNANYDRAHNFQAYNGSFNRFDSSTWGVGMGLSIGGEYFTRWHFSLAAHTTVANVGWSSSSQTSEYFGGEQKNELSGVSGGLGVNPSLILRVYF